jgi:hypothetical protein
LGFQDVTRTGDRLGGPHKFYLHISVPRPFYDFKICQRG